MKSLFEKIGYSKILSCYITIILGWLLFILGILGVFLWAELNVTSTAFTSPFPITIVKKTEEKKSDEDKKPALKEEGPISLPSPVATKPSPTDSTTLKDSNAEVKTAAVEAKKEEVKEKVELTNAAGITSKDMFESTKYGDLPIISKNGANVFDYYKARKIDIDPNKPKIVLVMNTIGPSTKYLEEYLSKLPSVVTIASTPYAENLADFVAKINQKGHEVLINIPMEIDELHDPGPYALLANEPFENAMEKLHWCLGKAKGYIGISNYGPSPIMNLENDLKNILGEARKRGLMFFDNSSVNKSMAVDIAKKIDMQNIASSDIWIDCDLSKESINQNLSYLEKAAIKNKVAIGVAYAYPLSLEIITEWINTLESKGIALVPLSSTIGKDSQ